MGGGELTSEDTEQCTKLLSFPPLSINQSVFQDSYRVDDSHIERKVIPQLGCVDKTRILVRVEVQLVAHCLDVSWNRSIFLGVGQWGEGSLPVRILNSVQSF